MFKSLNARLREENNDLKRRLAERESAPKSASAKPPRTPKLVRQLGGLKQLVKNKDGTICEMASRIGVLERALESQRELHAERMKRANAPDRDARLRIERIEVVGDDLVLWTSGGRVALDVLMRARAANAMHVAGIN